jgi:hypothetical protein
MKCFVCYKEAEFSVIVHLEAFSMETHLCKECVNRLLKERAVLIVCSICGTFMIMNLEDYTKLTGRTFSISKWVNTDFTTACWKCGGDIENIIGHA